LLLERQEDERLDLEILERRDERTVCSTKCQRSIRAVPRRVGAVTLLTEVQRPRPSERFSNVKSEGSMGLLVEVCLELVLRRAESELLAM